MPYFQIHGCPNCPNFGHAIIVAEYMSEHLPNFEYRKVEVAPNEWGEHLMEINIQNNWYVMQGPLIWKEINHWGGKKYLIGGLGEFWEYVYCYYGLESRIPKSELENLAAGNMKFFEERQREKLDRISNARIVSILGASNNITYLLLNDLFEIPNLRKKEGIIVRLYDEHSNDERKYKFIEEVATYYNSQKLFGGGQTVYIVDTIKDLMVGCDLLIIVEDTFRPCQTEEQVLEKCFARMNCLSDATVTKVLRNLRIVVACQGPSCFLATCLIEFCTTLYPSDIVAITADEGLSCINVMSDKTGIPVHAIAGPPVWGFIGMNSFIDVKYTTYKADVYRPNLRSLTAPHGSTLPLGTVKSELRLMSYLITDQDEIVRIARERKKYIGKNMEHPSGFGKIRAIISLLKLWYSETYTGEIISLGVCSDGSFGIPPGMVFSQPVMLNKKNKWVPFQNFPLMNDDTKKEISRCVECTSEILKKYHLLRDISKDKEKDWTPKQDESQSKSFIADDC